jgi:GNAT superfamily N-acetyltransferase
MTDGVAIRPVCAKDFEQWLPLWSGYNEFYGRAGPTALPRHITDRTWSRFLAAHEPVFAIVAEQGDQLVGFAHYLFHRTTIGVHDVCYLQDLFTDPSARRNGVASALTEHVYRAASLAGASKVYWQTHETNVVARQLYDRLAERSGFLVYRKLL